MEKEQGIDRRVDVERRIAAVLEGCGDVAEATFRIALVALVFVAVADLCGWPVEEYLHSTLEDYEHHGRGIRIFKVAVYGMTAMIIFAYRWTFTWVFRVASEWLSGGPRGVDSRVSSFRIWVEVACAGGAGAMLELGVRSAVGQEQLFSAIGVGLGCALVFLGRVANRSIDKGQLLNFSIPKELREVV